MGDEPLEVFMDGEYIDVDTQYLDGGVYFSSIAYENSIENWDFAGIHCEQLGYHGFYVFINSYDLNTYGEITISCHYSRSNVQQSTIRYIDDRGVSAYYQTVEEGQQARLMTGEEVGLAPRSNQAVARWTIVEPETYKGVSYAAGETLSRYGLSNITVAPVWDTAVTVTIDPNGGVFRGSSFPRTITQGVGARYRLMPQPKQLDYNFVGWYSSVAGSIGNSYSYTFSTNATLTAEWGANSCIVTVNAGTGISNVRGGGTYTYGTTVTISATVSTGYTFNRWTTTNSSTATAVSTSSSYSFTVTNDITFYAWATVNSYYLDLNGVLDGTDSGGISPYATCDVYINGSRVASGVNDYYTQHPYGSTYEIRNIQCAYDKAYVGVASGSISGTITGNTSVVLSFRTMTWEDYASSSYASGSGTASDPYIIKSPEQLGKLIVEGQSHEITSHYKLGANIDLSAHEWKPIGIDQTYRLQGTFDGDMYTISNMKVNLYYDHAGLFATVVGNGIVKNLIVKGGSIVKGYVAGGIAGLVDNGGTVQNCIVENIELASDRMAGGITGWSWNSNIEDNMVRGCTISSEYAGGIFGDGDGSGTSRIIDNGAYSNTIIGRGNAGIVYGIIITPSSYTVNGCYGQGTVNGTATKVMYGDSSAWGNWTYSPNLNGGNPVQRTLFAIGGISGSANVYNYLRNTLGFTAG